MIFNKSMKKIFYAKIRKFFLVEKKLFTQIKEEKKLFETAEWLKKIVCWLTKMGTPLIPIENNGPSTIGPGGRNPPP